MSAVLLAAALLAMVLLLPATPGTPLTRRYRPGTARLTRMGFLARLPADQALRLLPRRYRDDLSAHLLRAALPSRFTLLDLVLLKGALALLMAGFMPLYWTKTGNPFFLLLTPLSMAAGWTLPDFAVKRRSAERVEAARRELPQVLSTLAVCLQTGLSLRSSLTQLPDLLPEGVLRRELRSAAAQLASGATPQEAVASMVERVRSPELVQAFGTVLQHAERSTLAAGAAAAAEARAAWQRKRRRAEALAHTAALKLFFPQLILGLPAIFLVLLGPAALKFLEWFRSM